MRMIHYLHALQAWHWFSFALILLVLEYIASMGYFLIWLSLAAALVGLLLWLFPEFPWPYQLLIFSLSGIICSVSWWAYLLRHSSHKKNDVDHPEHK